VDGRRCIRYFSAHREDRLQRSIAAVHDLTSRFGRRITIATVVPASLKKHFIHYNPGTPVPDVLAEEQTLLTDDIQRLNEVIIESNSNFGNDTINLCNRFLSKSKKRNRRTNSGAVRKVVHFVDKNLIDSIHFDDTVKSACFANIFHTAVPALRILNHSNSLDHYRPLAASDSSSSSQESLAEGGNGWDFKRHCMH
jgi:hypothetical protein